MSETAVRTWRTSDMKNAAVLLLFGHKLVRYGKENGRAFLDFEESDARERTIIKFWDHDLPVDALSYNESLNRARDLIIKALNS